MNAENSRLHTSSKTVEVASDFTSLVRVMANVMNRKNHKDLRVVGMDCEFIQNGNTRKPVLLQLANPDKYCGIFQLSVMRALQESQWEESLYAKNNMSEFNLALMSDDEEATNSLFTRFRPSFENIVKEVLEDGSILKVGVGVDEDAKALHEHYGILCKGFLDIRYLADELGTQAGGLSLNDLAEKVLGEKKFSNNKKKNDPSWDNPDLKEKQIDYAATDALHGVLIFLELNDQKMSQKYKYLTRMNWDEKTYWSHTKDMWTKYIGEHFTFTKLREAAKQPNVWTASLMHNQRNYVLGSAHCVVCGDENEQNDPFFIRPIEIIPVDYNIPSRDGFEHSQYLCLDCMDVWQDKVRALREELTKKCGAPRPAYDDKKLAMAKDKARKILLDLRSCSPKEQLREEICKLLELSETEMVESTLKHHALLTILSMDCWIESDHGSFVLEYFVRSHGESGGERLRFLWCHRFCQEMSPEFLFNSWYNYHYNHKHFMFWDFCDEGLSPTGSTE